MSRFAARATLSVFGLLALSGLTLGWSKGQLPLRDASVAVAIGREGIAPDLALYRDVIAEVRAGNDYYAVAREQIPRYGFPISSPLNWRLPTYAWLLSGLPGERSIQAALVALSALALALAFVAQMRTSGVGIAAVTTFLLLGVVRWSLDGFAFLAQEPWAAALMLVSLSAHALGGEKSEFRIQNSEFRMRGWRFLAVLAGVAALFFRELALPFCAVAGILAGWNRRWREAAGWFLGIVLFFAFFAWHVAQVQAQGAGGDVAAAGGLGQWLRFGGLDFVLLTMRMNSLLFAAPAPLLWAYLLLSLLGLSRGRDETSRLACLAALGYMLAFAIAGRPENFYWGLMTAPLLAWGAARGPQALLERWLQASQRTSAAIAASHFEPRPAGPLFN